MNERSSEAYGHGAVWRIAGPMILSAVTTPLLGMVDTAVVGHLPDPIYLGAVAVGATIFTTVFMGLNFLRMGTTGITAQTYGAGDPEAIRASLGQAAITAGCLAAIILVLQQPLLVLAMQLLAPSPEVAALTGDYFRIRVWSAPASLLNFVLMGWLLGMQNARGVLVMTLTINSANILLDLWFVLGLGLDVRGVAAATLLAELFGTCVGVVFVRAELANWPGQWSGAALAQLRRYRRLFDVNANLFLRTMALMFVFAFITARGARLGDVVLAANAVLMNFQFLLSYALDGIAHAAEALVGKAVGARNRDGMLLAVRRTFSWSLLFAGLFTLGFFVAGGLLIDALTGIDAVRDTAREYLPWLIVSPLISFWSFLYDGVYVGATRSREMMVIMVGAALLLFLPAWYVADAAGLGNHALWLAFTLFMAGRALGMHAWWRRIVGANFYFPEGTRP
ncbi:MAG: MATE family efflux transporter [Gammaproteobacteria bacterium]|nr:MATE family efflux transporter [Gammaproteobacteria bacterium]